MAKKDIKPISLGDDEQLEIQTSSNLNKYKFKKGVESFFMYGFIKYDESNLTDSILEDLVKVKPSIKLYFEGFE